MFADALPFMAVEKIRQETVTRTERFLQANYLLHQKRPNNIHLFTDLWPFIPRDGMRPLQQKIEKIFQQPRKPLALILEAPMGEGKTEAALYAAFQLAELWKKRAFMSPYRRQPHQIKCMNELTTC